jgi:hypothetical protein
VEVYTKKVNAHIQRHEEGGATEPNSVSSEETEERRELLKDTIDESDIVKIKTS